MAIEKPLISFSVVLLAVSYAFCAFAHQGVALSPPVVSGPSLAATDAFIVEKLGLYHFDFNDENGSQSSSTRDISVSPSRCIISFTWYWEAKGHNTEHVHVTNYPVRVDFSDDKSPDVSASEDKHVFMVEGMRFNDVDTAERVLKADQHARELCRGSHQEPF